MISPIDLKFNALKFATESLDDFQYKCFVNFVCYVNQLIIKDYKKICYSNNVIMVLNTISDMQYHHHSQISKNCYSYNDGVIDPIITNRTNLIGLDDKLVFEACKKYFKSYDWEFNLIKEYKPEHRVVKLTLLLDQCKFENGYYTKEFKFQPNESVKNAYIGSYSVNKKEGSFSCVSKKKFCEDDYNSEELDNKYKLEEKKPLPLHLDFEDNYENLEI